MPQQTVPYSSPDPVRTRTRRRVFRRLGGLLGVLTAAACGAQVYYVAMWGVWGAPPNPLSPCGMLGGFALFLSAMPLAAVGRRWSAVPPLFACGLLWLFYAPALADTAASARRGGTADPIVFVPPALLASTTLAVAAAAFVPYSTGERTAAQREAADAASRPDPWLT